MSNLLPYTREEINAMHYKQVIELTEAKSPRLHPYCLIGLPLCEVREKMREWFKGREKKHPLEIHECLRGFVRWMKII